MDFLEYVDFLGQEFKFSVKNRDSYKTKLGGFLTILIIICSISLVLYYARYMYYHEDPNTMVIQSRYEMYPSYTLNNKQYNMPFRVVDQNNILVNDPRFLAYHYYIQNFTKDSKEVLSVKNYYNFTIQKCNTKIIDSKTFLLENFENFLCIDYSEHNFTFGGDHMQRSLFLPRLVILRCNNITEKMHNIKCATDEELKEKHGDNLYLQAFIHKNLIDPSNYDQPLKQSYEYYYNNLDLHLKRHAKSIKMNYKKAELISDIGYVFENLDSQFFLELESYTDRQESNESLWGNLLVTIDVILTKNYNKYKRTYLKIPNIVAIVGGLFAVMTFILNLIYLPFWKNEFKTYMHGSLYHLEEDINDKLFLLKDLEENQKDFYYQYIKRLEKKEEEKANEAKTDDKPANKLEKDASIDQLNNNNIGIGVGEAKLEKITDRAKLEINVDSPSKDRIQPPEFKDHKSSRYFLNKLVEKMKKNPLKRKLSFTKGKDKVKKDIVINKDIERIIDFKEEERPEIILSKTERFFYSYLGCCVASKDQKFRKKVLSHLDDEYMNKVDILQNLKLIDQIRLLKKIILNEHQCFMIQNRDKQTILSNTGILNKYNVDDVKKDKQRSKIKRLADYLEEKTIANLISSVDMLLLKYLEPTCKVEALKLIKEKGSILFDDVV